VSCYRRIVEALEPPVFGIQVPFPERNGGAIPTIEALAARHVELIVGHRPAGPIRLVGWSAGATLALEIARQLTAIGRQPQILVNIDQPLDNSKGVVSPYHSFLENLCVWLRNEPKRPLSKFAGRLAEKAAEAFKALTGRPSPPPVHDPQSAVESARTPQEGEFVRRFYQLAYAYIPPRAYSGQVLSFVSTENEDPERLVRSWKAIAPTSRFIVVRGDHHALVKGPSVIALREHLRTALAALPAGAAPARRRARRWF
jgi:phthiocerol/phenolphthiocerol synthesis type-I polyketide synthase D